MLVFCLTSLNIILLARSDNDGTNYFKGTIRVFLGCCSLGNSGLLKPEPMLPARGVHVHFSFSNGQSGTELRTHLASVVFSVAAKRHSLFFGVRGHTLVHLSLIHI